MAWWCENAFPSLMQPAIQTSTAFTVNNRLTLTKMHHIGIGKELSFLNSWTTQGCRSRGAGRTVNPISTRGADYAHHSTTSPPGFSDFATKE